ncbi:MAG: hypothetical protein R2865_05020 [Deinococcales bacterium]
MFFPILWMALTSFKTEATAISFPPKIFFEPTLDNWRITVLESAFPKYLLNTLSLTFFSTLLALLVAIPAAYAMAFYPTKRTDSTMLWIMSTRMLPPAGHRAHLHHLSKSETFKYSTWLGDPLCRDEFPPIVWMMRSLC